MKKQIIIGIICIILSIGLGILKYQTAKDLEAEKQNRQRFMRENAQQLQKVQQEHLKEMVKKQLNPNPVQNQPTPEQTTTNSPSE